MALEYVRWKSKQRKQGKQKQADIYFRRYIVCETEKIGRGGVKGVAKILDDLDDNYYKKKSYYSWEKAIYRWRYEFKKSGLNMTLCPLLQSAKTATRLTNTAGPITSYANMVVRQRHNITLAN